MCSIYADAPSNCTTTPAPPTHANPSRIVSTNRGTHTHPPIITNSVVPTATPIVDASAVVTTPHRTTFRAVTPLSTNRPGSGHDSITHPASVRNPNPSPPTTATAHTATSNSSHRIRSVPDRTAASPSPPKIAPSAITIPASASTAPIRSTRTYPASANTSRSPSRLRRTSPPHSGHRPSTGNPRN